jgi:hypothetical protein
MQLQLDQRVGKPPRELQLLSIALNWFEQRRNLAYEGSYVLLDFDRFWRKFGYSRCYL